MSPLQRNVDWQKEQMIDLEAEEGISRNEGEINCIKCYWKDE